MWSWSLHPGQTSASDARSRRCSGITLGFGSMVVAVGLGLAGLVHSEPRLHSVLRYAGAAYLVYLAWRIARSDPGGTTSTLAKPIGFLAAALFTWMNPKRLVSVLGAIATYITVGGNVVWETSVIAAVLAIACLISCVVWAGFGAVIGRFLANPRARKAFNWCMAGLLVLSVIQCFGTVFWPAFW